MKKVSLILLSALVLSSLHTPALASSTPIGSYPPIPALPPLAAMFEGLTFEVTCECPVLPPADQLPRRTTSAQAADALALRLSAGPDPAAGPVPPDMTCLCGDVLDVLGPTK